VDHPSRRGTGEARVLVVGARRMAPGAADDGDWVEEAGIERLRVGPLDDAGVHELVDASLGTGLLPQALYDWLGEHSGGNPGALQSLLHHLIEQRVLRYRQGEWKPSLPSLARLAARREDLGHLDGERLAALSPEAVAVLEAASVVGEPFHWRRLAELMDEPAEKVYGVAAALFEEGLLERPSEGESGFSVLGPGLTRTLYERLAPERRRELHRRWAELLETTLAERPERAVAVAEHYWQAGERARSLPHLLAAGEAALAVYGHREAIDFFARAAEVAAAQGDATAAFSAEVRQAEALAASGATVRALGLYRKLLARRPQPARRLDDRRRDAGLWLAVARLHGRLGEGDEELAAADRGLDLLDGASEPRAEVELMATRAEALARLGRRGEAFVAARQALRQATRRHLTQARAELLDLVGQLLTERGEVRKASFLLHRALGAAREVEDAALAARVRDHLGELDQRQGHLDDAAARYRRNLDEAQRVRDPWLELTALDHLASLELARSAWREARDPVRRALDLRRRLGAREGEETNLLWLGQIEEQLGDWTRAERHFRRVLRLLGDELERAEGVMASAQLASLARKRGDWAEAEELARRALTEAERLRRPTIARRMPPAARPGREGSRALGAGRGPPATSRTSCSRKRPGPRALARVATPLPSCACAGARPPRPRSTWPEARTAGRGPRRSLRARQDDWSRRGLALLRQATTGGRAAVRGGGRQLEELEVPFEYARTLYEWGVRTRAPRSPSSASIARSPPSSAWARRPTSSAPAASSRGSASGTTSAPGRRAGPGLWEVAKVVNSTLDLQEVLDRTMDLVLERLRAERGMVVLRSR
jgi:tetratricopeptide (TPR) repeat protein